MNLEEETHEVVWDSNRRLVCQPASNKNGFSIPLLFEKCQRDYNDGYEHLNACVYVSEFNDNYKNLNYNWCSVLRCTFVAYHGMSTCNYENQWRQGGRMICHECVMCDELTISKCFIDVILPCGQFFRQISSNDVEKHRIVCNTCHSSLEFDVDGGLSPLFVKNLHKCMSLIETCKNKSFKLHARKEMFNNLITKTCVSIGLHRNHLKHLFLNKKYYYDKTHEASALQYLSDTEDPLGYLICLHLDSEKCGQNLAELSLLQTLQNLELITFGRIILLDEKVAKMGEHCVNKHVITINHKSHDVNVQYETFNEVSDSRFQGVHVCIKKKWFYFCFQKVVYVDYHRITLLYLEKESALNVFSWFKRRLSTVVIDIICDYMIYDAIDHTVALCHMLFALYVKASKMLPKQYFDELYCSVMEVDMKNFIRTFYVQGSIAYPSFVRSLSSSLKRLRK